MAETKKSNDTATAEQVREALTNRYYQNRSELPVLPRQELLDLLSTLQMVKSEDDSKAPLALVELLSSKQPECSLNQEDFAALSFLDECLKESFEQTPLDLKLEKLFYRTMPTLAIKTLTSADIPAIGDHPMVTVLDLLIEHSIGWSSDLGRAGEKLYDKVDSTLSALADPDLDYQKLQSDLAVFFYQEQQRIEKLERRLADSESGMLRAQRGQVLTAQMLNAQMQDKQLPTRISEFLQGPWCDSLQLMLIQHGAQSEQWQRACKLTETLIWTLQPVESMDINNNDQRAEKEQAENEENRQRLYRIIEHIPNEIHELLVALKHDTHKAEAALSDIEMEHIKIMSGQKLAYREFTLLEYEEDLLGASTSICKSLLNRVDQLEPGQWFLHGDSKDQAARIKLVLKLDDVQQLLFTNRNGVKALQKGFEEFAYYLSSGAAKPLYSQAVYSSSLKSTLQSLVRDQQTKRKKLRQAKERSEQERIARETARLKALEEAETIAREREAAEKKRVAQGRQAQLQKAREEAVELENLEKLRVATDKVLSLNISAWLKLPDNDGTPVECKLAVKLAAVDKFIFADRQGVKIAEYSAEQLAQLLATEAGVILDEGEKFEDTLAKVVTGLRQDRNKSYDALSGYRTSD